MLVLHLNCSWVQCIDNQDETRCLHHYRFRMTCRSGLVQLYVCFAEQWAVPSFHL